MTERRVEHVMGMPVVVDVRDGGAGSRAVDEVFAWLRFVDATTPRASSRAGRGAMTFLAGNRVLSTERFLRHRVPLAPAR